MILRILEVLALLALMWVMNHVMQPDNPEDLPRYDTFQYYDSLVYRYDSLQNK